MVIAYENSLSRQEEPGVGVRTEDYTDHKHLSNQFNPQSRSGG